MDLDDKTFCFYFFKIEIQNKCAEDDGHLKEAGVDSIN